MHGLRHAFASLGLQAGIDLQVVSRALGHASVKIMVTFYVGLVESLQREAADRIAALLGNPIGEALVKGSVPQPCHKTAKASKKARAYGLSVAPGVGLEPTTR
ncbi:MAG: tyrosine-type recombinase/integrase [Candidatus Baltobacteraceae bacterium]